MSSSGIDVLIPVRNARYEIESSECTFIRHVLAHAALFAAENRKQIRWHLTNMAQHLLFRGDFAKALALTPPAFYARTVMKAMRR